MRTVMLIAAALGAISTAGTLAAQGISPTASVGVAIPTAHYGVHRTPGPVVRGGLALGSPDRRVGWRLEGEGTWLPDRGDGAPRLGSGSGSLRSVAVVGSLLAGPRHQRAAPYVIVGGGPQWIRVQGAVNPYGAVMGLHAGVGYRVRGEHVSWLGEVAWHVVASDFGTGREYTAGTYFPFTVGIEF